MIDDNLVMRPILFEWGVVIIPSFGFFLALGFLVGSFVMWRRLREDYDEEDLLSLSLVVGLFGLLGARIVAILFNLSKFGQNPFKWLSLVNYPGLSIYGAMLGILIGTLLFVMRKSWRFWEAWEGVIEAGLWVVVFSSIGTFLSSGVPGISTALPWGVEFLGMLEKRHPVSVYLLILTVLILIIGGLLRRFYRKISWYKSGKVGFVGLVNLALFFLVLLGLESLREGGLYWGQVKLQQILDGVAVIVCLGFIYQLSGRKFSEDRESLNLKIRHFVVNVRHKVRRR